MLSVRLRLTLWYTGVLALTLGLFSVALYLLLSYTLTEEVDRLLAGRAADLVRNVHVVGVPLQLQQIVLPDVDVFASPDIYLQVVDRTGQVVARSANLGRRALPAPGQVGGRLAARADGGQYETVLMGSQRMRLYSLPLQLNDQAVGAVQVARTLAPMEESVARLKTFLWLAGALMVVLASSLGWMLAWVALRPINRLTTAAREIGESRDLSRRVNYRGPTDEVGELAVTFNQMLERLEAAYARLEQALNSQRRFVTDASHELRTPLTVLRGNLDVLRRVPCTPDQGEALEDMAGEAERMGRLVDHLLTLARADAGLHLELQPVPLLPLFLEVARAGEHLAGQRLRVAGEEALAGIAVQGSADHIRQVLLILLDNAGKYGPPDSPIVLLARREPERVGLGVADRGPGIDPADVPHIFERFYRSAAARGSSGSGLGLSIAAWIAREHGGRVEVDSAPGQGSTFMFWLPLSGNSYPALRDVSA